MLNVEHGQKAKRVNLPKVKLTISNISNPQEPAFAYQNGVPADKFVKTPAWSENTKVILHDMSEYTGIKSTSLILLKDNDTAIKQSRKSLIDLIKYYEGDNRYFYEAYTTPYKDKGGHTTTGFGETTNVGNRTQEQAYAKLCGNLKKGSDELRTYLNKKCGKGTYDNLPQSIKEGLLDLWLNKGLPGVKYKGKALTEALKNKDYASAIENMQYVSYLDKKTNKRVETEGLYRRSLSRMLLAARDLNGTEKNKAMSKISNFYNTAHVKYKSKGVSTADLDDVMNDGTKNIVKAQTYYELKADSAFKGRGTFAFIESTFKTLKNPSWNEEETKQKKEEFKSKFMKLNNNPQSITINNTYKIPLLTGVNTDEKNIQNRPLGIDSTEIISEVADSISSENVISDTEIKDEEENDSKGSFGKAISALTGGAIGAVAGYRKAGKKGAIIGAIAGVIALTGITKLFKSLFKNNEVEDEPKTAFQKMLNDKNTTVKNDGDFKIVTTSYTVPKGDNLYRISKKYDISRKIIQNDNNIEDENKINEGQVLEITKLGYEIKSSEKISDIADRLGVSEEMLRDINAVEENESPREGSIIEIPGFIHYVKQGETLYSISKEVGVSIKKLKEINKLTSDTIHPGDKIKVVYNNSDFDVPDNMKKEIVDNETKTTTTLTNVSKKYKKDFERTDILPEVRELLKEVTRVNGKVVPTRKVYTAKDLKVNVVSDKLKGKTIIINAGHGYKESGVDRGVIAVCDMNDEWIVNANNAIRLAKELCAQGAKVIYLQGKRDLITAALKKKENKADMFISVHANSAGPSAKDRTMFVYRNKDVSGSPKENSIKFATIAEKKFDKWIPAHEDIKGNEKFVLNGKQDYAQVSTNDERTGVLKAPLNHQQIPGIIWEVGFMTSKKGQQRLTNTGLMDNYAKVMTESVIEYFN